MTENMIRIGTIKDFSNAVKAHGIEINEENVSIVKKQSEKKIDVSLAREPEFFNFIKSLGLTSNDIAVVTAKELMESTSEQKAKVSMVDLTSSKKLKR